MDIKNKFTKGSFIVILCVVFANDVIANNVVRVHEAVAKLANRVHDLEAKLDNFEQTIKEDGESLEVRLGREIVATAEVLKSFRKELNKFNTSIEFVEVNSLQLLKSINSSKRQQQIANWRIAQLERESNNTKSKQQNTDKDLQDVLLQQEQIILQMKENVISLETKLVESTLKTTMLQNNYEMEAQKLVLLISEIKNEIQTKKEKPTELQTANLQF